MSRPIKFTLFAILAIAALAVFVRLDATGRLMVLIALAFISLSAAFYYFITRDTDLYRRRIEERLQELLAARGMSASQREMRLLKEELLSDIPPLHRLLLRFEIFNRLKELLRQAELNIVVNTFLLMSLISSFIGGWFAFVMSRSIVIALIVMPLAAMLPLLYVRRRRRRRFDLFIEQLPDALELMIRSLQAGHSFTSALQTVATEMPDPIAREFGKAYEEQNLGLSTRIALENLVERVPITDLKLCVTAILIQREIGGNLAEVMHNISHTIRERFRIQGEIRVKSAQARLSGYIVSALPFVMFLLISLANPTYLQPLYEHEYGSYIITLGIAMQITGWIIIRRITRIEF
jgi:tight adherence protein B